MSEKKTSPYRYLIAHLLDDLPVGTRFKPSVLHLTILPWFALETEEGPFIKWFYSHFGRIGAFEASVGEKKLFGPGKDVPVHLIEPADKFMDLHKLALSWFGQVGARWAERDPYVGDDYVPHVAERRGYVLTQGETLHISSLTLFKAARREDHVRLAAARIMLS